MTAPDFSFGRRSFLGAAAATAGSWAVPTAFLSLLQRAEAKPVPVGSSSLRPVRDEETGLELIQLPEGFRYRSFGWKGDPLADGSKTPGGHDGMGVIVETDGIVTLCRNHELNHIGAPFGSSEIQFDTRATGGCSNLTFDTRNGKFLKSWASIAGTANNCAGGPTPWGTWLTCEETVVQTGDKTKQGQVYELDHEHGYIFEVPASRAMRPQPLKAMGRFVHEAIAVDPNTGIVYETEDRTTSGFYHFLPKKRGDLASGGELQMLRVTDQADLTKEHRIGVPFSCSWVTIADPAQAHSPGKQDALGVFTQGKAEGATTFARLEGCWWGLDSVFFTATSGGRQKLGQVWRYEPKTEQLSLVFESPGAEVLDSPDNLTVSPRGGLVLCEDPERKPAKMLGLTPDGRLLDLAANNVTLNGERNGLAGDFLDGEWAGATFSPDGQWLFANLQSPGITVAITGPWAEFGL